jgi:hypothetical protein
MRAYIIVSENAVFLIFFKLKKGLNSEKGPFFFLRLEKKVAKKDPSPTKRREDFL